MSIRTHTTMICDVCGAEKSPACGWESAAMKEGWTIIKVEPQYDKSLVNGFIVCPKHTHIGIELPKVVIDKLGLAVAGPFEKVKMDKEGHE